MVFICKTYFDLSTAYIYVDCQRYILVYTCTIVQLYIVIHCNFFGRNYLVRLRPFGRSCRAMELQRTACKGYFTGKQTSTTMIPQVSTTLTTFHYNLSSLL